MRLRQYLLGLILALIFSLVVFCLYANSIAVYFFSRAYDLDVYYKSVRGSAFSELVFGDLLFVDRRSGLGISAGLAKVRPKAAITFDLGEVHFIKRGIQPLASYDNLSALVSVPFNSRWTYRRIYGRVKPSKRWIEIESLEAVSDDIKLSMRGSIYPDHTIKSDIVISFSDKLIAQIPEELSEVVLRDESEGWKSLSVKLEGDYDMPSIQVSGKLFRLNIKTVAEPKN